MTATIRHQLENGRTFPVRSDYFQVNWTVKSRRGKGLKLLRVGVDIHDICIVQTSGIVHDHSLGRHNFDIFTMAYGEIHYLFLTI
jgi:hypothetical protein